MQFQSFQTDAKLKTEGSETPNKQDQGIGI